MPQNLENIQLWVIALSGQSPEAWQPILSPAEWQKAMRYRFLSDQTRSAVTRGALRMLLGRLLNQPPTALEFAENAHGKPYLAGNPVHFNASHSGDFSLIAFSPSAPIGVDVEHISSRRAVDELSHRILTPAELARFSALSAAERQQTFYEIWTLKESVLKAIGSGLSVAPEAIEINFHPLPPKLLWADPAAIPDVSNWTIQNVSIGHAEYAAAFAIPTAAKSEIKYFESPYPDSSAPKSSDTPSLP